MRVRFVFKHECGDWKTPGSTYTCPNAGHEITVRATVDPANGTYTIPRPVCGFSHQELRCVGQVQEA